MIWEILLNSSNQIIINITQNQKWMILKIIIYLFLNLFNAIFSNKLHTQISFNVFESVQKLFNIYTQKFSLLCECSVHACISVAFLVILKFCICVWMCFVERKSRKFYHMFFHMDVKIMTHVVVVVFFYDFQNKVHCIGIEW